MSIPKKFYNVYAEGHPVRVRTVGELVEILKELPSDLKINQDCFSDGGAEIAVLNFGEEDCHLCFREPEEDDEGGW